MSFEGTPLSSPGIGCTTLFTLKRRRPLVIDTPEEKPNNNRFFLFLRLSPSCPAPVVQPNHPDPDKWAKIEKSIGGRPFSSRFVRRVTTKYGPQLRVLMSIGLRLKVSIFYR